MSDESGYDRVIAAVAEMGTRVEKRVDRLDEKVDKKFDKVHDRIDEAGKVTGTLQQSMVRIEERQRGSTWKSVGAIFGSLGLVIAAIIAALFAKSGGD